MAWSKEELKGAWKEFVTSGRVEDFEVRPEILASWQRSRSWGVDPYAKTNLHVLEPSALAARQKGNEELLEISIPAMRGLFEFVRGSGFVVALADSEGYLLRVFGDEESLEFTKKSNFVEGGCWSEKCVGTNAVGLALVLGAPIQVWAAEHFCRYAHPSTCSAAPLRDPSSGKVIGVLDLTGPMERAHPHSLGMVVAAASSVENQLALGRALLHSRLADQHKTMIMESMSDGVLTVDEKGTLTHFNPKAGQLLRLGEQQACLGRPVVELLGPKGAGQGYGQLLKLLESQREATDEVITVQLGESVLRFTVTCRLLRMANGNTAGAVLILQEISRVNRLIHQMIGSSARARLEDLIGEDLQFKEALHLARTAAGTACNVLLWGETGTGKDLLAQAIHNASQRASQPFVAINCAAIPRDLLGSELFGYAEGAFTGARRGGNAGKFELADGGTIFLDEIGEMPLDMQTFLLRVLEEHAVIRLGGREVIPVDVKVIAATNKDLAGEVSLGNFRGDLYYRLNVLTIHLPPLRQRKGDIIMLAEHLMRRLAKRLGKEVQEIHPDVLEILLHYDWPGNVRELQNVIERAVHLVTGQVFGPELLPLSLRERLPVKALPEDPPSLKSLEEAHILSYLQKYDGNLSLVARKLGIARSTLYRKLQEFKIR